MEAMSLLDAAMITGDWLFHPINIGAVLILEPPDGDAAHFADNLHRSALGSTAPIDNRLRRFPYRSLRTGGLWTWRDDNLVDLEDHLHRLSLPAGSSRTDLWRLIGQLHGERLDRSRPMWTAYLIDGLADNRVAFYVKVHHVMADGVAGLQMISNGLSTDPDQRDMPPFYAAQHTKAVPSGRDSVIGPLAGLGYLAGIAASGTGLLQHILQGQAHGALATLSGHTTVPAVGAPFTPFNRRLGPKRGVVASSWAKSRIRAVQQATNTKAHDVVTAVVGGVLRGWLSEHGALPSQSLVALCPITVRGPMTVPTDGTGTSTSTSTSTAATGNRFGAWLCPIGTDLADPVQRLQRVHRSMHEGKRHVARYGSAASLSLMAPSIASTILQAVAPVGPRLRTGYNVPVSSVPGPRDEMYWNGAHVEEIYPVSSVFDGQTLNVTACSYSNRISIGYVADGDVMPDLDMLVPLTERCLAELEAAVGIGPGAAAADPDRTVTDPAHPTTHR